MRHRVPLCSTKYSDIIIFLLLFILCKQSVPVEEYAVKDVIIYMTRSTRVVHPVATLL